MKKIFSILLIVMLLLTTVNIAPFLETVANAATVTTADGIVFDRATNTIVDYIGNAKSLNIPPSINGVDVLSIGEEAFQNCDTLQYVSIPTVIKNIHDYSFDNCSNITYIALPKTIDYIGTGAFRNCSRLQTITIREGVVEMNSNIFDSCTNLSSVIIYSGPTSIAEGIFRNCPNLTSVVIPSTVTVIDANVFADTPNVTICAASGSYAQTYANDNRIHFQEASIVDYNGIQFNMAKGLITDYTGNAIELNIPSKINGVHTYGIHDAAFKGCTSLKSVTIPNTVSTIRYESFSNCINLNDITLSDSVAYLGGYAFKNCDNITTITIPSNVAVMDGNSFESCDNLTTVNISDGVREIRGNVFKYCGNLTAIFIPSSVTGIGANAFSGCPNVTIYGISGSYAQTYANNNSIPFVDSGNIITDIAIEGDYFSVIALKEDLITPVPNLTVTLQDLGTATTNEAGMATFAIPYPEDDIWTKNMTISGTGYVTINRPIQVAKKTLYETTILTDDGSPKVFNFADNNDLSVNLLNETKTFTKSTESRNPTTYKMEGYFPDSNPFEYRIIQNQEIKMRSSDGYFDIDFSTDFDAGYKIYVQVVDSYGNASEKIETSIQIFGENTPDGIHSADVPVGSTISLTIPEDIPLIGGEDVELGFGDALPLSVVIDENMRVTACFGTDKSYETEKKNFEDVIKGRKNMDAINALTSEYAGGFTSVNAKVLGYGEGYVKNDTVYINLQMMVGIQFDYTYTWYTFISVVPVYFQLGAGADMSLSDTIHVVNDPVTGWDFDFGNMELNLDVYGKIGAGVGVAGVLSVGGEGKLTLSYLNRFSQEYHKLDLTLSSSVEFHALMFHESIELTEDTWLLSEGYGSSSASSSSGQKAVMYTSENYVLTQRATPPYSTSASIHGTNTDIVEANTFQNAMPKMIVHNGVEYIFWLSDNLSRPVQDRSMLVYSKNTGGVWSSPVAIEDDNTADGYFDVVSDTSGLYVVWHDSNTAFAEEVTLEESMAASEINLAFIDDATSSIAIQNITNNDYMDTIPKLSVVNNNGALVWASNDENNVFMDSGVNTIYTVPIVNGVAGAAVVVESASTAIYNLNMGYLNSEHVIAYVKDADNDLSTTLDTEIYVKTESGSLYNFTNNSVADTNVYFGKLNATDMMFWYSDGDIYYLSDLAGTPSAVLNDIQMNTDRFEVITDGAKSKIIWNEAKEVGDSMTTALYACDYNGAWSNPYEMTELGEGATLPTGYISTMSRLCYLVSNGDGMDLITNSVESNPDLTAVWIVIDDAVPDTIVPIDVDVVNSGMTDISSVDVEIFRNDVSVYSGNITQDILISDTATISIADFTCPADTTLADVYRIEIRTANENDTSDNALEFKLGYSEVQLETERSFYEGEHLMTVYLSNSSVFATGGTLYIKENDENGTVLYEESIAEVNDSEIVAAIINISEIDSITDADLLYVEFVCDVEDKQSANNSEYQYIADELSGNGDFAAVTASGSVTQCSTVHETDGSVLVSAQYGSGYYEYSIDGGLTWQQSDTFTLLVEGEYTILIRDLEENENVTQITVNLNRADYNNDLVVDMLDLVAAAQQYNTNNADIDLNGDGIVNLFDLIIISGKMQE